MLIRNLIQLIYQEVLGFKILVSGGNYVEFAHEGVRFALCMRSVMHGYSEQFQTAASGQIVELAFPCGSPAAVDQCYDELVAKGAVPVRGPENMPWRQRTAFFADPDGNIHEIFAELPE
ncbi:glyoxalase-like protein [Hydrogenispora ethanolica]|uniref:Glyoxalase-like protein n=1 Tax=Hydrogenispora ethanolica TaxID=1082276 RepID=A0A4R1S713_HYDET|nr:VOC family protein [Hydrogenispora ethanolica]TCL75155.1 glyoxalase-like protein [Hydrogenispora ethanolica]